MTYRTTDRQGRLSLGGKYANTTLIIEEAADGTVVLRPAAVVPAPEAWLYKNKKARALVERGLRQARAGRLSADPPDLAAAAEWADALED